MSELVKYHNNINKLSFNNFTEKELNVFFSIVYKIQNQGSNILEIPFTELRNLSNGDVHLPRFLNSVKNVSDKISNLNFRYENDEEIVKFYFFNKFRIRKKEKVLILSINEDFQFLVNNLLKKGNFTILELENFVKLKSVYSKTLFRILKQWDSIHYKKFELQELRELLDVPASYSTARFNQRILTPMENELKQFFPHLTIEKKKTGKVITEIEISWGKKEPEIEIVDDIEVEISEELDKAFEKASHNRYISPFLTKETKIELIECFKDEKILAKGLYFAYKTINTKFTKLSYLIKTITTGAIQQNKILKVENKEENNVKENDDNNLTLSTNTPNKTSKSEEKKENLVGKSEITEEEFEEIYQKYLKDNNIEDRPFTRKCFAMPYSIIKKEDKKLKDEENIVEDLFVSPIKEAEKVYTAADIPEEKLLDKKGNKLTGSALKVRENKILKEMNKC
nr:replication initiation protein [uncultured Fusobacterium sp.]